MIRSRNTVKICYVQNYCYYGNNVCNNWRKNNLITNNVKILHTKILNCYHFATQRSKKTHHKTLAVTDKICKFAIETNLYIMSKFIIYQIIPRLFTNYTPSPVPNGDLAVNGCGKFNDITPHALKAIRDFGATHIWYTGILEHATKTDYSSFGIAADHPAIVKGKAGSPYAVKDYYDVDPDLAVKVEDRMQEFEKLVKRTHRAGLKVIIDFVPNHVSRQYHSDRLPEGEQDLGAEDHQEWAFSPLNNFYYIPNETFRPNFDIEDYVEYPAKATGNDVFNARPSRNDWYETVKLNYGVFYQGGGEKQFYPIPDTWHKMLNIVRFWAAKGIDGFRCDMAEMVPHEFWTWMIAQIKKEFPGITFIAEVYNPMLYRTYLAAGFDYLYDKVGLYDTLRNVTSRSHSATNITRCWQAVQDIEDHMLNFLENHDEQRIASGFYCGSGRFAQPAMIVAATLTKAPVMIYMGQELGELGMDAEGFSGIDGRTTIYDYWSLKSIKAWANNGKFDGAGLTPEQQELRDFYSKLMHITLAEKAIANGRMYDLQYAQNEKTYNKDKYYAYFRQYIHDGNSAKKSQKEQELLLIIVNFDDKDADVALHIPQEALTYLGVDKETQFDIVNLLDDSHYIAPQHLDPSTPFLLPLPAWKGAILKLTKKFTI